MFHRVKQRTLFLIVERDDEQPALHQHTLLFGQGVGKHRHFVFVAGIVYLANEVFERCHIFDKWCYDFCYVLTAAHHHEFKLAQMVVGRSLESGRDYFVKDFIAYFAVGVVAVCSAIIQYF